MSNFTFLTPNWPDLYETAREAEQTFNSAPRTSCFYARRSLERAVYANDSCLKQPYADNLAALIHEPSFRENLDPASSPRSSPSRKSATWPSTAINRSAAAIPSIPSRNSSTSSTGWHAAIRRMRRPSANRSSTLLDRQLKQLEAAFLKEGGLRERMMRARLDSRKKGHP